MLHNDNDSIKEWTQRIKSLTSELNKLKHLLADAHYHRGAAYQSKGDIHNAFADYRKVKEFDRDYISPAQKHFMNRDFDAVIADSTQAIQQNPDDVDAYMSRGAAYFVKKNYDAAFADLNKAVKLEPNNAKVYLSRWHANHDKGNYCEAISDINEAIRLVGPDNVFFYLLRANTYDKLGDHFRAAQDREKSGVY